MSIAGTRCTEAVAMARRVLRLAGVRRPDDIDVELIAADWGICSIPKELPGHEGNLIRIGGSSRALVAIDARDFGTPRGDFTLGHELGHKLLHANARLGLACFARERSSAYFREEREADVFAVELKMPAALVGPRVTAGAATLEHVRALAATFRASLSATALRFVDFWPGACAVVLSRDGRIRRHAETRAFPLRLVEGFPVGPAAFAYSRESLAWHEGARVAERVRGDAWSRAPCAGDVDLFERSVKLGESGLVLTLLTA